MEGTVVETPDQKKKGCIRIDDEFYTVGLEDGKFGGLLPGRKVWLDLEGKKAKNVTGGGYGSRGQQSRGDWTQSTSRSSWQTEGGEF